MKKLFIVFMLLPMVLSSQIVRKIITTTPTHISISPTYGHGIVTVNMVGSNFSTGNPDSLGSVPDTAYARKASPVFQGVVRTAAETLATMAYVRSSNTIRPLYYTNSFTHDSASVSQMVSKSWFRTDVDSIAIDSIGAVLTGEAIDTLTIRICWGGTRVTATDSTDTLRIASKTTGTKAVSTKVIPPESFVWITTVRKTGTPSSSFIYIDGRRKWY